MSILLPLNGCIGKWLDILVCGTLSNVFAECNKFGLNICPPSTKFTPCQTVLHNPIKWYYAEKFFPCFFFFLTELQCL